MESQTEFPELSSVNKSSQDTLDYKRFLCVNEETITPVKVEIDYSLKPGWICMTQWPSPTVIKKEKEKEKESVERVDLYQYSLSVYRQLEKMETIWHKYMNDFIELHGEEEYHRLHEMPDSYYESLPWAKDM